MLNHTNTPKNVLKKEGQQINIFSNGSSFENSLERCVERQECVINVKKTNGEQGNEMRMRGGESRGKALCNSFHKVKREAFTYICCFFRYKI